MANQKLSALTTTTTPASGDKIYILDISDTTDGADGSSRAITYTNFVIGITGLSVAQGGTGAATLTGILKGNGTSAVTAVTAPSGAIVGDTDTQTLTNKTLTSPKVGTDISDTNGNELIKVTATASAVNEVTVSNAATGNAPSLAATGGDTNIDLNLITKGTGVVKFNGTAAGGLLSTTQFAPQGFLINGKIVPSVAANDLTVAIKGMDGNDPSASNPVYCRIGDTVRTITSALSVTKNDGTNWFGSGDAELATLEVDYFVYLGYNATDGVTVGFSRIPYAVKYGDFSATTTNEKYAAISTITTANSADYYEVIGRFAATLSAGAGYTWTVPTFTATNLIQRPIFETRKLSYNPVYTGFSVNPTAPYSYKIRYATVSVFQDTSTGNDSGTSNATGFTISFPFISLIGNYGYRAAFVRDNGANQTTPGNIELAASSRTINIYKNFYSTAFTNTGAKGVYFGHLDYIVA